MHVEAQASIPSAPPSRTGFSSSRRMDQDTVVRLDKDKDDTLLQSAQANLRRDTTSPIGSTVAGSDSDCDSEPCFESDVESGSDSDSASSDESVQDPAEDDRCTDRDFYNQLITRYEHEGPTMANRGDVARSMIRSAAKNWDKFCTSIERQPADATLKQCSAPIFKSYLHWICKHSRIKKESSITTYWKVLSMYYCDETKQWMENAVLYDIGNWITAELAPEFSLDNSTKIKSGLYVTDLDLILHHHWVLDEHLYPHERVRTNLAAILVLAGATSTRPGALIENLRYRDVKFQVFKPLPGSKRARLGMVVTLTKTKRSSGRSRRKEYGFHEEPTLLHDPVLYMLSLAFADGAFLNDLQAPEEIYELKVPGNADRVVLPWKPEWLDRPVFRAVQGRGNSAKVALDKAFQYQKARASLIRLGRALGFEKQLEWYDLRRGSGKKLNEALTPEERNHSMGHSVGDSSTYQRFYMPDYNEVDFQEIVFGSEPQRDLIHLMGRLLRHGDAPTSLSKEQKAEVDSDPKLRSLRRKRESVVALMKRKGWTIKKLKATVSTTRRSDARGEYKTYDEYQRYNKKIHSLRQNLQARRLARAIREFHGSIHGQEISRQLKGVQPSEYLAPPNLRYQLPARGVVAKLFSKVVDSSNGEEIFLLRMRLVRELALLSNQSESPPGRKSGSVRQSQLSRRPVALSKENTASSPGPDTTANVTIKKSDVLGVATLACPLCRVQENYEDLLGHMRAVHGREESVVFR
ncbi:hypothetical protein J7T55_012537, partial [Diaporthe amygdali]|uniref:uncharacterized protein n=1 Tax=Phomopsis amygdali TaxID=1214568 RepID=UPI0022FE5A76